MHGAACHMHGVAKFKTGMTNVPFGAMNVYSAVVPAVAL